MAARTLKYIRKKQHNSRRQFKHTFLQYDAGLNKDEIRLAMILLHY